MDIFLFQNQLWFTLACRSTSWLAVAQNKRVDMSSLFEENEREEKEETRFTTARSASCMISKLEEVAKAVKFRMRLQG
ncbi:hypothetical protein RJ639_007067 [Escallonia herrerae]|uniref:NAF domain-containing protein n=1 Tax=Escallonia herrerae TaxID=1293975 RepID=A0AA88VXY5_9ASTE|nr:hypothetical protein RJ639_007067 [Escallonia herrerae]